MLEFQICYSRLSNDILEASAVFCVQRGKKKKKRHLLLHTGVRS